MPRNPKIYPNDFSSAPEASKVISTFDSAIQAVEINARDTSLKQAYKSRVTGQDVISVLGQISRQNFFRLPLQKIGGGVLTASSLLGTAGYYTGGRDASRGSLTLNNIESLRYSNETTSLLTAKLSENRSYGSICGNASTGKIGGGTDFFGQTNSLTIDKLDYGLQTCFRISTRIPGTASDFGTNVTGGMGTTSHGLMVGVSTAMVYNHAFDSISLLTTYADYVGYSIHHGLSSRVNGYLWSRIKNALPGFDWAWASPDRRIVRASYATSAFTPSLINKNTNHDHGNHAAANSKTNGYVMAGAVTAIWHNNWHSDDITRFNFAQEQQTLLTAKLSRKVVCMTASGSSLAAYTGGGDAFPAGSTTWVGTTSIEKLTYTTESISIIGARLIAPVSDHGTLTDYNPSWSY